MASEMFIEPLLHLSALQGRGLFADGLQGHMELALEDQLFVVFDDVGLHGHASQNEIPCVCLVRYPVNGRLPSR